MCSFRSIFLQKTTNLAILIAVIQLISALNISGKICAIFLSHFQWKNCTSFEDSFLSKYRANIWSTPNISQFKTLTDFFSAKNEDQHETKTVYDDKKEIHHRLWHEEDFDRPIQLVYPDQITHKKLVLHQENIKILQQIQGKFINYIREIACKQICAKLCKYFCFICTRSCSLTNANVYNFVQNISLNEIAL